MTTSLHHSVGPQNGWRRALRRAVVGTLLIAMTGLALASFVWNPFPPAVPRTAEAARATTPPTVRPTTGPSTRTSGTKEPRDSPKSRVEILSQDDQARVVRHLGGVTRVPLDPKRIVALNWTDDLVALGVKPYAVVSGRSYALVPDYLGDALAGCKQVPYGHLYDPLPSFDFLAEFEPDLILAQVSDRQTFDQFSSLAPTIVLRDGASAKENTDLDALKRRLFDLAKILGKEAEAKAAIKAFDEKLARARKDLGPILGGKTVACFRCRWQRWHVYGPAATTGMGPEAIFNALGIKLPPVGAGLNKPLDLEDLMGIDADYIIVAADDTVGAPQELNRLRHSPIWNRISAVRNGRVLTTSACNHYLDSGLMGKSLIIDELYALSRLGTKGGRDVAER